MAYFGRDKNSLPALFNSLHITGNPQADKNHPFLHRIPIHASHMNGIAQFYEAYPDCLNTTQPNASTPTWWRMNYKLTRALKIKHLKMFWNLKAHTMRYKKFKQTTPKPKAVCIVFS